MYDGGALPRLGLHIAFLVVVVAGVAVAGCYDPRINRCTVTCNTAADCASGQTCESGFCQRPGDTACTVDTGDASPDMYTGDALDPDAPPATGTWRELSVGGWHSCAITTTGELYCWGNNDYRQLGRTTPTLSATPWRVNAGASPTADWEHVSAGYFHTCATRTNGELWCWGSNDAGQCGRATGAFQAPLEVEDPAGGITGTRWTAVTTGASYTCAIRDDGTLWCFGGGAAGQIGQGTANAQSSVPVRVGTGTDWRAIDSGYTHICGIHGPAQQRGQIACWGYEAGQSRIGDGGGVDRYAPSEVMDNGVSDWKRLSAGDYSTCAIEAAGQVWCWGSQFHVPGGAVAPTPARYGSSTGYERTSMGAFGGCYVDDGSVTCFGYNQDGPVGAAPVIGIPNPVAVAGISGVVEIGAGSQHTCVLDSAGAISCWGSRSDGQLGDGIIGNPRVPTEVLENHHPWRSVHVSTEHTCGVTMAGQMFCWGDNWSGQLGGGFTMGQYYDIPILVAATGTFDRMANGYAHSCGLTSGSSALWCWGNNDYGQRGATAPSVHDPVAVDATPLTELATGRHSNCGVTAQGARRCWGANDAAQLGNGGMVSPVSTPTTITETPNSWSKLSMGDHFGCGLAAGVLHCWGRNNAGQAAHPTTMMQLAQPGSVTDPTPGTTDSWIRVSAGASHACGLLSTDGTSGTAYCWGYNGRGQLGTGGDGPALLPIPSVSNWIDISAGYAHTCGVRATGQLHCWGSNDQGELGDNSNVPRGSIGTPVASATDWVAVDTGQYTTCGIRGADRRLYCWGDNRYGQTGTGGTLRWMPGPLGPTE